MTDKKAILVVSFGTSFHESRELTIAAIEKDIAQAFPQYEVRRAFTSQMILDKLKKRDGLVIDNVKEALDRAVADGVKKLVVLSTHFMNGYEYLDLAAMVEEYKDKFDKIRLTEPLLGSAEDFKAVMSAMIEATASFDDGRTAICFMGHGTEADANIVYTRLQKLLTENGYRNYYIGTVEATPSLEDVIARVKEKDFYKKVVLQPLMIVAGDHANHDMAGEEEGSWKTAFEKEGYQVECILKGLGQLPAIRKIYNAHAKAAEWR